MITLACPKIRTDSRSTSQKQKKQQWTKEADEKSCQSRGEYLYELIEEARAYRRQGFLAHHDSQDELDRLKRQVAELQDQLAKDQQ